VVRHRPVSTANVETDVHMRRDWVLELLRLDEAPADSKTLGRALECFEEQLLSVITTLVTWRASPGFPDAALL
jgi:hypothetical protein